MFLSSKSAYQNFFKDHVTLKTEVMMLYMNKKNSYIKNRYILIIYFNITVFAVHIQYSLGKHKRLL